MLSPFHLSLKVISSGQPPLTLQTKHILNFLSLSFFIYSCDYVPCWILRLQRRCLCFAHKPCCQDLQRAWCILGTQQTFAKWENGFSFPHYLNRSSNWVFGALSLLCWGNGSFPGTYRNILLFYLTSSSVFFFTHPFLSQAWLKEG